MHLLPVINGEATYFFFFSRTRGPCVFVVWAHRFYVETQKVHTIPHSVHVGGERANKKEKQKRSSTVELCGLDVKPPFPTGGRNFTNLLLDP